MTARSPRIAIVSDTVDDINGVALGLRRFVAAARRTGHTASLIGARPAVPANATPVEATDDVVRIPAAMSASLPFYAELTWSLPELPPLVDHLARNADVVQLATPGPMGIAGLMAARMLGLPVVAQYHTEVAAYAGRMTGLPFLEGLVAPIVGWFYKQADLCLAPSDAVVTRLAALGIAADRIRRIRRGVDLSLFHPTRRDRAMLAEHDVEHGPVALYVGRLSREKNLDVVRAAWALVNATHPAASLVVVGDGPYASGLAGPNVVALGTRHGTELAAIFASADLFVFPSETETFGNVVIEAAASGVPSIVAAAGAAHELVIDGVTGDVIDGRDPVALARAIVRQLNDAGRRTRMGVAARKHANGYELATAVDTCWRAYHDVIAARRATAPTGAAPIAELVQLLERAS